MWSLAAVLIVVGFIAVGIYRELEQIRQKMTADGWSNVQIAREGRYFQVMGSKDQQTGHFTIDAQTGSLRGDDDDG